MWHKMEDGSHVSRTPDGWRVRNPDKSYAHIVDPDHEWDEANTAFEKGQDAAERRKHQNDLFRPCAGSWVSNAAIAEHVAGLDFNHIELGRLLRKRGGMQQKRGGVRGWYGVELGRAGA